MTTQTPALEIGMTITFEDTCVYGYRARQQRVGVITEVEQGRENRYYTLTVEGFPLGKKISDAQITGFVHPIASEAIDADAPKEAAPTTIDALEAQFNEAFDKAAVNRENARKMRRSVTASREVYRIGRWWLVSVTYTSGHMALYEYPGNGGMKPVHLTAVDDMAGVFTAAIEAARAEIQAMRQPTPAPVLVPTKEAAIAKTA